MDMSPPYPIVKQKKPGRQIHISNLQPGIHEEQLCTIFSAYGELDFIYNYTDIMGNNCAYITFTNTRDSINAFRAVMTMVSEVKLIAHFTNFYPPRPPTPEDDSDLIDESSDDESSDKVIREE